MSDSQRPASPTTRVAEEPAQQTRLSATSAAAVDPPSVRPPLSAAQSCATDTLALVFEFIELKEMVHAALTCPEWYSAAAKKPRGLIRTFNHAAGLADLCASSSPFKRHIIDDYCR